MIFIERLKAEQTNLSGNIFLYEDGSKFIKALERSAYLFCQVFKPLVPLSYNNREYGGSYVTIGFPKDQLEKYITPEGYTYNRKEDGNIVIHSLIRTDPIDFPEKDFEDWKNNAIMDKKEKKEKSNKPSLEDKPCTKVQDDYSSPINLSLETKRRLVIADIMQQPLADYTPMRALIYLNSLQERIRNEGISE